MTPYQGRVQNENKKIFLRDLLTKPQCLDQIKDEDPRPHT